MNDPQIWWYVTRTSAVLAWVLLTISVMWGILLSTRVARRIDNPSWLQDLHRYLSGTALVMVGLHIVSLMLDEFIQMSPVELLVPFATDFKPLPVALGIGAMYVMVAVYLSSLIMDRLPRVVWKGIHISSYAVVLLVAFHAGWTGSDVGNLWYQIVATTLIGLTMVSVLVRVLVGRPAQGRGARAAKPSLSEPLPEVNSAAPRGSRQLTVTRRDMLTPDIVQIDFATETGESLPVWQPGDHISLSLPNGTTRQYSLCGDPANSDVWTIAVKRSPNPEGASVWILEQLAVGDTLPVNGPAHKFELVPAHEYLFIAGGIGITAIWSMIQSLPASREWKLMYFGTRRKEMAFADELLGAFPDNVVVWESEHRGRFSLEEIHMSLRAQVYACGPESMLQELESLVPAHRMHLERFSASDQAPSAEAKPFTVQCRKSKISFQVSAQQTMLQVLEEHHIPVLASCRDGICGTCEVRVKEGVPEHHDEVLDEEEKQKLKVMYPCVSRAQSDTLVIDV